MVDAPNDGVGSAMARGRAACHDLRAEVRTSQMRMAVHVLLVPLGVLAACGRQERSAAPTAERVAEVRALEVRPRAIEVGITAVGTIEPENRVTVASQEAGVITALAVREGDRVRTGDSSLGSTTVSSGPSSPRPRRASTRRAPPTSAPPRSGAKA